MKARTASWSGLPLALAFLALLPLGGCRRSTLMTAPPLTLGTDVDQLMQTQEENAEAAKFVIYAHEFELNQDGPHGAVSGVRLNEYGQDHVRQIAANLIRGDTFPVVVERSQTSPKRGTVYGYRVHFNEPLDRRRLEVVVLSLKALGVDGAEQIVGIAPAFSEGYTSTEAAQAYYSTLSANGNSGGSSALGGGFGR